MPGFDILGSIIGSIASAGDRKRQNALEQMALDRYGRISEPILKELQAQLVSTGDWDNLPSDFGNKGARDEAISRIMEEGTSGGMDPQSRLALEEGRQAAAAQESRGRANVRQEAQRRGMGGLGEFLGQMSAQQAGAQSASLSGMHAAADARDRALQALEQGGNMAAQAEGQDFGRASRIAAERSAIARYNADMGMRAQEGNNAISQQRFGNTMQLANAQAGAMQRRADQFGRNANRTASQWAGIGSGVEGLISTAGSMVMGAPPGMFGGAGKMGGGPTGAPAAPAPSAYGGPVAPRAKYSLEDAYGVGGDYMGY